ncbi:MAG TPA: ABC transporter permease subunit [Holophaga sp.]|nr:ABC transporter permease subunit [Holophaga sp.]
MIHHLLHTLWGQASSLFGIPLHRRRWMDLFVIAAFTGLVMGFVLVARQWTGVQHPLVEIDLSPTALPKYALLSLVRASVALGISLSFSLSVAYWAAKDPLAEKVLIPILDILQSVPLLAFLPVVLLAMVRLFPHSNMGLELSAVLLIVTCQAWNLAFSFYQRLKTLPSGLDEAATAYGLSRIQRLRWLEIPFATPDLVWNAMVSVANGWFFLMASEAFNLGRDKDFRLPGLGAYMSSATERGDLLAQIYAILAMLVVVIVLDQLLWKPIVAWSQRFLIDESGSVERPRSWLLRILRRSELVVRIRLSLARLRPKPKPRLESAAVPHRDTTRLDRWMGTGILVACLFLMALVAFKLFEILAQVHRQEWLMLLGAGGSSLGRVLLSTTLATCWTLPVGLWIGLSPIWSKRLQSVVQIVASFPASLFFLPLTLWFLNRGVSLNVSAILLMAVSTQWYLLFNIIAGAQAIPASLRETAVAYDMGWWRTLWRLHFPAIFPQLIVGWVTAAGGAWNASIICEFVKARGTNLTTTGLGAIVTRSADQNNIPLLAAAALLMAGLVVLFNRLVWDPLLRLAENRYNISR